MSWPYIAGYFDGEGCLLLGIVQDTREEKIKGTRVQGWNIIPSLSLQSGDYEVLENINKFLNSRNIKTAKMDIKKRRDKQTKDFKRLSIMGWDNIKKTIKCLLPYSISKWEQLSLFNKLYGVRKEQWKWSTDNFLRCMKIVDEINSHKGHYRNNIRTYEFFNKMWSNNNES